MVHITTLEIDEVTTEVKVDFTKRNGEIEIEQMTDLSNGCAIAPDLLGEINSQQLDEELSDAWAEFMDNNQYFTRYSFN